MRFLFYRTRNFFAIIGILCLLGGTVGAVQLAINAMNKTHNGVDSSTTSSYSNPPTKAQLLGLVNEERAKAGVEALTIEGSLNESAQYKADDMNSREYFSHFDPISGSKNGLDKAHSLLGDQCLTIGENIRLNGDTNTAQAAVDGWIGSPTHFAAMKDPRYKITGFGISGSYIVEHFC